MLLGGLLFVGPRVVAEVGVDMASPAPNAPTFQSPGDWTHYGNTAGGDRHSLAGQITPENVANLKVAWSFRTGDLPAAGETKVRDVAFEATPLKIGDKVFLCTPHSWVIALDAETGKPIWKFDPKADYSQSVHLACRGVSY